MGTHIFDLRPCSESDCFYSSHSEDPIEQRCIGHLRLDFGSGNEFWTSWWPHTAHRHNDAAFKAEFSELINHLRKSLLKNRASMYKYLAEHPGALLEESTPRVYGYCIHTGSHSYYIRCTPERGNYSYIYCYLTNPTVEEK